MNNLTNKNDPNYRGQNVKSIANHALRTIWQGRQDLNLRHPVLETRCSTN